jgi:hypothetical protein
MPEASEGDFCAGKRTSAIHSPGSNIPTHYKGRGLKVDVIFRSLEENTVCVQIRHRLKMRLGRVLLKSPCLPGKAVASFETCPPSDQTASDLAQIVSCNPMYDD